jgi:hypothetical protein
MKGKITIVLLSLVLVFGMIAASCGDGDYPENPYKTQDPNNTKKATDYKPSPLDPANIVAGKVAALNALPGGITLGVLSGDSTYDATNKVVKVVGGSSGFTGFSIDFSGLTIDPALAAGSPIKITYSCVIESSAASDGLAHTIAKTGATGAVDFTTAQYPRLEEGTAKTVTINTAAGDNITGIKFQHNAGDGAATYYIKVTKVEKGS